MTEAKITSNGQYACPSCGNANLLYENGELVCLRCLQMGRLAHLKAPARSRPVKAVGTAVPSPWVPDAQRLAVQMWSQHHRKMKRRQGVEEWLNGWDARLVESRRTTAQRNRRTVALRRLRKIKSHTRRQEQLARRDERIAVRAGSGKKTGKIRAWWYTR